MNLFMNKICAFLMVMSFVFQTLNASSNQTNDLSQIFGPEGVPYTVKVTQADFSLPVGLQSYAFAKHHGKILLIGGKTNALHCFHFFGNDFPVNQQNTNVFVIDPEQKVVFSKSLADATSGLTQEQIDALSATDMQFYQSEDTLYIVGGYGIDTPSDEMTTKSSLTAISVPGFIDWVITAAKGRTAAQYVRQVYDPVFQVSGGGLVKGGDDTFLLVFGQASMSSYKLNSKDVFNQQIRRFGIIDKGDTLEVVIKSPLRENPNFRRRDANIVPFIHENNEGHKVKGFVVFSGGYTENKGIWTLPVLMNSQGETKMEDPNNTYSFKQGMNHLNCATVCLYSKSSKNMYVTFFGGRSFGYWSQGEFHTSSELPFINQFSTIQQDKNGIFTQYLMEGQYPMLLSSNSNYGNPLLFGSEARFIPVDNLPTYDNGVMKLDELNNPKLIGYIIGGIQSSTPDKIWETDSAASPFIFNVFLHPRK